MRERAKGGKKKKRKVNCTSVDCGIIHLFLDRKTYSQYLFIYVLLATCFLKLVLKNAHLAHYVLSLEKQTSYKYSYYWHLLQKMLPSHLSGQIPFCLRTHVKLSANCTPFLWSKTGHKTKDGVTNRIKKVMSRSLMRGLIINFGHNRNSSCPS